MGSGDSSTARTGTMRRRRAFEKESDAAEQPQTRTTLLDDYNEV